MKPLFVKCSRESIIFNDKVFINNLVNLNFCISLERIVTAYPLNYYAIKFITIKDNIIWYFGSEDEREEEFNLVTNTLFKVHDLKVHLLLKNDLF